MLVLDHSHADYFVCFFFVLGALIFGSCLFLFCLLLYRSNSEAMWVWVLKFHMGDSPTNVNLLNQGARR